MTEAHTITETLAHTPLHALHLARGAHMAPFAGYDMPAQYAAGVVAEHEHTRSAAGLFDVSPLGQAFLIGADHASVAAFIETMVAADIRDLAPGHQRYTQLLNDDGGILDDLVVTRSADADEDGVLMLVVNAARKDADCAHISARLPGNVKLLRTDQRALIALQGPQAAAVLVRHCRDVADMAFMTARSASFDGIDCLVSRSGYSGEDGYEISVKSRSVGAIVERLLDDQRVRPAGHGARETLRLEAGLCLYGQDIDETTSPVEAGLAWSIGKRRREEAGFAGATRVLAELRDGPARLRVGIRPEGRAAAHAGAAIHSKDGAAVGTVTSGAFGPTIGGPIAMGYVPRTLAEPGTALVLAIHGEEFAASVVPLPFVPHRYHRAMPA